VVDAVLSMQGHELLPFDAHLQDALVSAVSSTVTSVGKQAIIFVASAQVCALAAGSC
jgi:hypothetical protein